MDHPTKREIEIYIQKVFPFRNIYWIGTTGIVCQTDCADYSAWISDLVLRSIYDFIEGKNFEIKGHRIEYNPQKGTELSITVLHNDYPKTYTPNEHKCNIEAH
jgi:hypothetical protein